MNGLTSDLVDLEACIKVESDRNEQESGYHVEWIFITAVPNEFLPHDYTDPSNTSIFFSAMFEMDSGQRFCVEALVTRKNRLAKSITYQRFFVDCDTHFFDKIVKFVLRQQLISLEALNIRIMF